MIPLAPPLRPARIEDAPALARLVNYAGEGLPLHLWTQMAEAGEDPWKIGARRQEAKVRDGRIVVIDEGARRLCERTGYREAARRPMVKDCWQSDGTEWVLLVKDL